MKEKLRSFLSTLMKKDRMVRRNSGAIVENQIIRSEDYRNTVVLPTLACPIPEGHNAIWCSSFQLAWNELRKLLGGAIEVDREIPTVSRLNASEQSENNLESYSYYAAAGFGQDGIVDKIRNEMRARFSKVDLAFLPTAATSAVYIFGYLEASVKYQMAFDDCPKPLLFRGSSGTTIPVSCFGVWPASNRNNQSNAGIQVRILLDSNLTESGTDIVEFALDLSSGTRPYQLVLAQVRPAATLEKILQDLDRKIVANTNRGRFVFPELTLKVPNMLFRITHQFTDLEGINVRNAGPIAQAGQIIEFKLNRFGAEVASRAGMGLIGGGSGSYVFDQPFLVLMRKRGNKHPFFAMWIDNAELLTKV